MTLGMITIGGLTRLTESGLSMTSWKPIKGILPPLNDNDWNNEFNTYKTFPEYKQRDNDMTLSEFKRIFMYEYIHRIWGRTIGIVFSIPFLYFTIKGYIKGPLLIKCSLLMLAGGCQGLIGWWMVKSGLNNNIIDDNKVARVSHYRLAIHLGSAVAIYSSLMWIGLGLITKGKNLTSTCKSTISSNQFNNIKKLSYITGGMIATTIMSGALVAGLDAGLIYNTFPLMGDQLIPEGWNDLKPLWLKFLQNETTVQFDHRWLGMSTATLCILFWIYSRRVPLPPRTKRFLNGMIIMAIIQSSLGISTLLTFVNTHLAAAHQTCSILLLTTAIHVLHDVKRLANEKDIAKKIVKKAARIVK